MSKIEKFRRLAEEAREMAKAGSEEHRNVILSIAKSYEHLAQMIERKHPKEDHS